MRHRKKRLQLSRFTSWRKATLNSLARNLLIHQRVKTSRTKAKAVVPQIEKLITLSKNNSIAARRSAFQILCDHKLVSLLFNEIGPRFANRRSGFTRIINLRKRRGDNAELVILELTEIKKREVEKPKKKEEARPQEEKKPEVGREKHIEEKPPITKKPIKKFLGGLRTIFKKERDSL
jgi:large subunit ribosomal protein L17